LKRVSPHLLSSYDGYGFGLDDKRLKNAVSTKDFSSFTHMIRLRLRRFYRKIISR